MYKRAKTILIKLHEMLRLTMTLIACIRDNSPVLPLHIICVKQLESAFMILDLKANGYTFSNSVKFNFPILGRGLL